MIKWLYQLMCRHRVTTEVWSFSEFTGQDQIESMCNDCDHISVRKIVRAGSAPSPHPREHVDHMASRASVHNKYWDTLP